MTDTRSLAATLYRYAATHERVSVTHTGGGAVAGRVVAVAADADAGTVTVENHTRSSDSEGSFVKVDTYVIPLGQITYVLTTSRTDRPAA